MIQKFQEDFYNGNYSNLASSLSAFIITEQFNHLLESEQVLCYYYAIMSYFYVGKSQIASEFLTKAKEIFNNLATTDDYIPLIIPESYSFYLTGAIDQGIEYCKNMINLYFSSSFDTKKDWYILIISINAMLLDTKGSLNESLDLYKKCISIGEKILPNYELTIFYNNISAVYITKGEYDKALYFLNKALLIQKEGTNNNFKGALVLNIGEILYFKGDYSESLVYVQQGIEIFGQTKVDERSLFESHLISLKCNLAIKNYEQADLIIREIDKLHGSLKSITSDYYSKLANAIYFLDNSDIKVKLKALSIFESLVDHELKDNQYNVLIIVSICELNFLLLRLYNDSDLLEETMQMVNDYYERAKINSSFSEIVQLLYLKSKLFLLDNNYEQAEKYLNQALLSAEEHGLDLLRKKIYEDSSKLKENVQIWKNAFTNNYNYAVKLDLLEIEEYFKEIKKLIGG